MMRAEYVDAQRDERLRPGLADMGDAGAVIHSRRLEIDERPCHRIAIQKIDRIPQDPTVGREVGLSTADMSPRGDRRLVFEQMIEEMTAGEASGARDQRRTRHGRQSDATLSV